MIRQHPLRSGIVIALCAVTVGASEPKNSVKGHGAEQSAPARGPAAPAAESPKAEAAQPEASPLKLAHSLAGRGDLSGAEIGFRQVIESTRTTPEQKQEALLGLARLYRRHSFLAKSATVYEKLLSEFPRGIFAPDALLELGRTLRSMGAHRQAIGRFYNVLNATLKVQGDELEHYQLLAKTAQFEIAETHFETGNYEDAVKSFNRLQLLDLAPADRARAQFMAAYSCHLLGNLETAAKTLHEFLESWPEDENNPEARHLLALTLRQLGRTDQALAETLELLRTVASAGGPNSKRLLYWQRRTGNQLANEFYQQGDFSSALAIYRRLAEIASEPEWQVPIRYQQGLCFERLRSAEDARRAFQTVVSLAEGSNNPELVELARMASWRLGTLTWKDTVERQVETTTQAAPKPESSP